MSIGSTNLVGQTLAHYEILSRIAEDGTGSLYLANDTQANRPVAIKTLSPAVTADPERWLRIEQDVLKLSRLEHPNIARVERFSRADGVDFAVAEAPEGESAIELLARQRPRRRKLLNIARQILSALTAADERGIVHGPLNPAFIFISPVGRIKLHDFGFSLLDPPPESEEERRAFAGDSAPYFSPEQAAGDTADARSDVFSFGAFLYHLASGKAPFREATISETWNAIQESEPAPITEVVRRAPPGIDRLLDRCLSKNPQRRAQQIAEIEPLLEEMASDYYRNPLHRVSFLARYRGRIARAAAITVGVAAITIPSLLWWKNRPVRERILGADLQQITMDSGFDTDPAISADGKVLVYASDRAGQGNLDIWAISPGTGRPRQLTSDPADEHEPAISPDGETVAFRSERAEAGIYIASLRGGDAKLLAPEGRRPRFSPDGRWIAYWKGPPDFGPRPEGAYQMFVVRSTGGTPRQIRANFASCAYPTWSPDSAKLLFLGRQDVGSHGPKTPEWWLTSLDEDQLHNTGACRLFRRQDLLATAYDAIPGDWNGKEVLFSIPSTGEANIWRASFEPGASAISARPLRVTAGNSLDIHPSSVHQGRVYFSRQSYNADIWGIPVAINEGKATGPPARWTRDLSAEVAPSIPADGSRLLFQSNRTGHYNLWFLDLWSGKASAVMPSPEEQLWPVISPDGTKVAFTEMRIGRVEHFYKRLAGGSPEVLCEDCGPTISGWSPDSKAVLIDSFSKGARSHLAVSLIELANRQKTVVVEDPRYDLHQGRFSPDGRAIAFAARGDMGSSRLYLAPFHAGHPVSPYELVPLTDGRSWDAAPQWSADGKLIYFVSTRDGHRCIWAQRLDAANRPSGEAFGVAHLHSVRCSPTVLPFDNVDLFVGHDQLLLSLGDQTGNIWSARISE